VHNSVKLSRSNIYLRENKVLRLYKTYLESRVLNPPLRPLQVMLATRYLHAEDVHAGALTRDLNTIQPFNKSLHIENDYYRLGATLDILETARRHSVGFCTLARYAT
jgi:hypothetical protein